MGSGFKCLFLLVVVSAAVMPATTASAQAYCALRDPVRTLYEAYPQADAHRSIIRTVSLQDRADIAQRLPFTIHFDEIGRHTLYVTLQDGEPVGLLHVRSERGRYGLSEIAWSLDFEGRVTGVAIQRSRDASLREAAKGRLAGELSGMGVPQLLRVLKRSSLTDAERVLVRSGAKTSAVTSIVWEQDLLDIRAAARAAPDALGDRLEIDEEGPVPAAGLQPSSIAAWNVTGVGGDARGAIARGRWVIDGHRAEVWWRVNQSGRITAVEVEQGVDPTVSAAFAQVVGMDASAVSTCGTAASVATGEMLRLIGEGMGR